MLVVPYLVGLLATGFRWPDVPLLGAWVGGYLLSYHVFLALKSRRPRRYRAQLALYGAVTVPLAAVTVVARPALLWYAPAYAALFAVNAWYAAHRRERAVLNDVASVVQSCLMVFVVATVAGVAPARVAVIAALCLAYFLGTVLYVKAMIRERGNPAYRRWSIGYHAAVFPVAALAGPWSAVLFGWLLVRAVVLPQRGLRPVQVGLVEIGSSLALIGVTVFVVSW
jgi:YwiC-like protein